MDTSDSQLRTIIDTIPALAWSACADGSAEFFNRQWLEYTGLSAEQAKHWAWTVAVHPDDLSRLVDYSRSILASGEPGEIEARLRRYDGEYRWLLFRANPLRDEAGKVVQWYGTCTDIEDRKRAEDEVRASERRLRTVLDSIPGLVCTKTPVGEVEGVNQPILNYTGKTLEELRNWAALVHPEDRETATTLWGRSIETGEPFDAEFRVLGADGEYRWFHARGLPLRDAERRVIRWYSLFTDIEDRKRAEEAARAREVDFRQIVDNLPSLIATMTAEGAVDFVSQSILDYTGWTLEELRDWRPLIHPEDVARVTELWKHSVETGEQYDAEHRIRSADGAYRWFHTRGVVRTDEHGRPVRWYMLLTDTDERHQIEVKLRQSEAFLLEAQRLSHTGSWRHDLASGTVTSSPELLRAFGVQPGEDYSEPEFWFRRIHPEDRRRVLEEFRQCEEQRSNYQADYRIVCPDGSVRHLHSIGHPVFDEAGGLIEYVGTSMDVTEQWQARVELQRAIDEIQRLTDRLHDENRALRASERELSLLVETIPGLVWCASADGALTYVNQRIVEYTGATSDKLAQAGWVGFLHPDDVQSTIRAWTKAVEHGDLHDVQYRLRRSDGAYRWFHVLGQPLRDAEGRVIRWYGVLIDIDDRKNMEEALRHTQTRLSRATQVATVGELAASIAHEINQPLAATVANGHACLRWLSAQPPNVAKAHEAAERIVRDGKDAGQVVERIRALFKRASVERVMLDLNEVIGEVLRLLSGETNRKGVAVVTELEEDLPPVPGDRVQLQQLMLNLLTNGIEAMDAVTDRAKRLLVRSKRESPRTVLVEIEDRGVGLKDPERPFEAFFTTKENGMGMGLVICRSIVEVHNGRLWATPGERVGTTFSFTLPVEEGAALLMSSGGHGG